MLKIKAVRFICFLPLVLILLSENCATARKFEKHSNFDYKNIYNQKYIDGNGGVIMVTLEKGETYSGSITPDHKYIFYTSNRDGNFDIFMKPLNDIISIPIVRGATNQTEPAISPDGKHLLFIDDELDPDGDIAMVKVKPESVVKIYSRSGQSAIDAMFINSKEYLTNDLKNISRSRESNPAWSSDGKWIVYASNKARSGSNSFGPGFGARQNIWIMPFDKPEKARQLTENGGAMPCFSSDGKKILYVNEIEGENVSHIYELEISTGISRQVTHTKSIDLSPVYSSNGKSIIFTRIYNDTNNDGVIDFKDHGQIMVLPDATNQSSVELESTSKTTDSSVQLTAKNENIFNTKVSGFLGGSILFAIKEGDNINLGVIPESGLYPVKKSSIEQLDYILNLSDSSSVDSAMALSQIDFVHDSDPLKVFTSTLSDFVLLKRYKSLKIDKKTILDKIEKKILNHNLFEKTMLDLHYKRHQDEMPENYVFLFSEKSLEMYLKEIFDNPASVLKSPSNSTANVPIQIENPNSQTSKFAFNSLSKNDQAILGYLFEQYAQSLFQKGQISQTRKIYQTILFNLPEYYNNANVLYELGKNLFDSDIPLEFLHILSANQYAYKVKLDVNDLHSEEESPADEHSLRIIENDHIKSKVENDIFIYFKKIYSNNQEELINDLTDKYNKSKDPFIFSLAKLSFAEYLFEQNKLDEALIMLQEIDVNSFINKEWIFRYTLLNGQILEKSKHIENAYEIYVNALLKYENKYQSSEIDHLAFNVFNYYKMLADYHKKGGRIDIAWKSYSILLKLILYLEPKKIAQNVVEHSSLSIFTELDEMLLTNYNLENETVKQVINFYKDNISFARTNSINPFIFGRAFLNAMLGIKLHQLYESKRELNKINKETILTYFSEAEEDFQWSIYADPSFADAYVMLGWMYQFIDEKRDSSVYLAKIGIETETDKVIFKSLYEKYFPDYLFEKNIQLYQKSIAFLTGKSSSQILQSFYLNLANNYLLLNNYTKAEEYYSRISIEGTNKFVFENHDQKAQYYFHLGKTNYFLSHYNEAINNFEKTIEFYPLKSNKNGLANILHTWQRGLILKYEGLVYSDQGQYNKAVDIYKQILKETDTTMVGDDLNNHLSSLYLEISRNTLAQIKVSHDLDKIDEALEFTILAETILKKSKEILAPKSPYRIKFFGFTLPFNLYFGNYDDNFKNGDNHLAFRLPTINQYQYLYSTQADLYKLNGNYTKAMDAIKKLIEFTEKDDTKHGKETRLSAFMRLGELAYIKNNLIESQQAYNQSKKMSLSENKMRSYYLSEKNLMTIACKEIEQTAVGKNKLELAQVYLKELNDFKNNYVKLKYSQIQKELTKKNSKMKLSHAEQNYIEKEAINDISGILIYQGILEAFISNTEEENPYNKKVTDLNKYYEYKINNYIKHNTAINSLDGNLDINNTTISILNKKTQKHLAMKLEMNKALVLESMGRAKEAMDIYLDISKRAYEFQANGLYIVSGFRACVIAKSLNIDAQKLLQSIDLTFKLNPYLVKQHLEIYQNLTDMIFDENIKNKQYYNAMYMENYRRMRELQDTIDIILNKTNKELMKSLNEYKELDIIEEILASDIEDLKIKREATGVQESIMKQLLGKKNALMKSILQDPELAGFAFARFPDMLTVNDVIEIKPGFLYLIKKGNIVNTIFKSTNENKLEFNSFKINDQELNTFVNLMKNSEFEKKIQKETGSELNRFINWIRSKQISIVFPDKAFYLFPFSKILKYNVAREYTFQAALLFEKNQTITYTNWIQNLKNKKSEQDHFVYNYVTRDDDLEKLNGKYNAIDYEITENDFSEKSTSILGKIINNVEKKSITLLSYNFKNNDNLSLYMNSLNLLFAASKSSMVIHTLQDRKSASEIYFKILDHKSDYNENVWFDGNLGISHAFFNMNKDENKRKIIQYEKYDLQDCISRVDIFVKDLNISKAISVLNVCENINYDINVNQSSLDKKFSFENNKPEYDLFYKKVELMLNQNSGFNINDVQKVSETFISNIKITDDVSKEKFVFNLTKFISLLFSKAEKETAFKAFKYYPEGYKLNNKNVLELVNHYYSGQMQAGNLEAFTNELPNEILTISQNEQIFNNIPSGKDDKIAYLVKQSDFSEEWYRSLLISGEYSKLTSFFTNANYNISLWEAICLYLSTGKLPPGQFEKREFDWIRQLSENPHDVEVYSKITHETNDENLKSYAKLIVMLSSKNYGDIFNEIKFLTVIRDKNVKQNFHIKLAVINYVMHHVDFYSAPEDFVYNVLTHFSTLKFDSDVNNKQQIIFNKLVTSALSYVKNFNELNKFQNNYPESLSEFNLKYIQMIKKLSFQYNPYEAISHKKDDISIMHENTELTDLLQKLEDHTTLNLDNFNLDYNDFSLLTLYHLKSKNYQKALLAYFSYDKNETPENNALTKTLHGIMKTFFDQYYYWTWNKDKVEFNKINVADIEKILQNNRDDIFYLPVKDELIRNKMLALESGIQHFTTKANINVDSENPALNKLTWNFNPDLINTPEYSIMKMYLPSTDESRYPDSLRLNIDLNDGLTHHSLVNFYSKPIVLESLKIIKNNGGNGNFHIIYTQSESWSIYLDFMKEYVKLFMNKKEQNVDVGLVFNQVLKNMEKKYTRTNDLKSIKLLYN